jgi:prophage DNA circulation protein
MDKADSIEAEQITQRLLTNLLGAIASKDQTAVNAKVLIGWTSANALSLIYYNQIWQPLDACFDMVRQTGTTMAQMEVVRVLLDVESPVTIGATLLRDLAIQLTLAQEGKIISGMTFRSRRDVDDLLYAIQAPFQKAEEVAADTMDAMIYRNLVSLRAAIVNHLVSTARPLPSILTYWFAKPLPSLVISQKLYGDASRYDEIRNENKVVHPAFCPPTGEALSQ